MLAMHATVIETNDVAAVSVLAASQSGDGLFDNDNEEDAFESNQIRL